MDKTPNFLILGAPKAATTSLAFYFSQHPQVFIPKIKEINYFGDDHHYRHGIGWYQRFFESADPINQPVIGEATPTYLYEAQRVAPRVKATLGNKVKFICLLRNPVTRAWSHYLHNVRHNIENRSFKEALTYELDKLHNNIPPDVRNAYFSCGNYANQIEKWYEFYGKEKFFFVLYEDLIKNPAPTIHNLFQFFELDDTGVTIDITAQNVGGSARSKFLMGLLVSPPELIKSIVKNLLPMYIRRPILPKLIDLNSNRFTKTPMLSAEDALVLLTKYRDSFGKLERLTGLDTSPWLERAL